MSEAVLHQLNSLGWEWRENGAIVCVNVDGHNVAVFVPLRKLWDIFNRHMSGVGCPMSLGVGDPFTVGGFFGSIVHAVSSVAKTVTKPVAAVAKAASQVTNVAKNYATAAINQVAKVPIIGPLAKSTASLMTSPVGLVQALASGQRIDKAALGSLKSALRDVKQIAPYAQTVLSFVPGVGQGLSGALGASLALASGQSLNDALIAGVMSAVPGGPLVQAAARLSVDALQGKPISAAISAAIINSLPISPQAKGALASGLNAAQAIARGQNVSTSLLDNALTNLPPAYQKAIQVGAALGHAKSLQDAAHKAVGAATQLAQNYAAGTAAAAALRSLPASAPKPPALFAALQKAQAARQTMANVVQAAQQGHTAAQQIVAAIKQPMPGLQRVGAPTRFVPIYIGAPLSHQYGYMPPRRGRVQIQPFQFNRHPSIFARRAA